ncbi:MAG: M4 family metallopeptidase [Dyadobacter sp.]|uniref:M4 family metallopeptidase n=1 Tax=Dyadobacter sp. TaxID=1914288 RepID=UPI001B1CFB11|nr:M4 family metallopeptidase [Dyadobacter sp.]MBO9617346.1 M4 family metallopeptidase [Dyadobacter sp.]
MNRLALHLLLTGIWISLPLLSVSQPMYNAQNVDRTAMSFFDGQQTFRALEYSTDPQGNNKVYRLQTLPENGFPAIILRGISAGDSVYFEDKDPFDNQFTDNPTPYLSAEAVQLHYGIQTVMKVTDERFGWKGLDGIGASPVKILMQNTDELEDVPSNAYYLRDTNDENFFFGRSLKSIDPFVSIIDVIAHEFCHGIFQHRANIPLYTEFCREEESINEGIAWIFSNYIKNKIKQSTPQNYNWLIGDQIDDDPLHFNNPKSHEIADTYNGQYYINECSESYEVDAGGGVVLKWYYLLSVGFQGSAYNDLGYGYSNLTGIGVEKAIQIVWDAMPGITINTDYPALRFLTLKAAEKLYGINSTEYLAVQNAWCAVGVCDNNQKGFTMSPANGAGNVEPWPTVQVSLTWEDEPVLEWEVQTSTDNNFSKNLQTYKVSNFTTVVNPKGGIAYTGTVNGYYHPGEKVYAHARITQAGPNFCRTATNPLCALYQQFGPAHAFILDNKKASFFSWVQGTNKVNPWKDPTLTWKSVNSAQKYNFQVFEDKALTTLISSGTVNHTGNFQESGVITTPLDNDKKYYTRVRALRTNIQQIIDNFGAWSAIDSILTAAPPTQVFQAKNQKANDPATEVSSMGFWVGWDAVPGADNFVIQIATDAAFSNIIRIHTAAGNLTTDLVSLPLLSNLTSLFVRVLPKKGTAYSTCLNVWRVITNQNAGLPAMKAPADGSPIEYKDYLGEGFEWKANTLNMALVDHFELHLTEKTSGLTTVYASQGKVFDLYIQDQLMFDDKQGIEAKVLAVGPLGAKSGLSAAFSYPICPDQPLPKFPGDFDKIDPSKAFTITWHPSLWLKPGDTYLVTIMDNGSPVQGFNNAPTSATSINVPANTLSPNKTFSFNVKNQGSCPGLKIYDVVFSTLSGGNNNPPATPVKNFAIELHGFRNDPDPNFIPPAYGTSDFEIGLKLLDPNGVKVNTVDGNGNPVSKLLVDSENAIVGIAVNQMPVGKYILRLEMLNIFPPNTYFPFDQPRFSVLLDGKVVLANHIITIDPFNPASPFNEWKTGFQFADIVIEVK